MAVDKLCKQPGSRSGSTNVGSIWIHLFDNHKVFLNDSFEKVYFKPKIIGSTSLATVLLLYEGINGVPLKIGNQ